MRRLLLLILLTTLTFSTIQANTEYPIALLRTTETSQNALDAIAFSNDGTLLASGGRDNAIRIWDVRLGTLVRNIEGHTDWVTSLIFSPDGNRIISGSRDNSVRVFDVTTGALLTVITAHDDIVNAVSITPDGRYIVSGGRDGFIKIHDMNATEIASLSQFDQPIWDMAFSPDGTTLATTSEDGKVWLWGLFDENGNWLQQLVAHETLVSSLAFSSDGRYLLTGGLDGTTRLWYIEGIKTMQDIQPRLVLRGHIAPIMGVGFSRDGRVAVTASLDSTVRMWDISGEARMGLELATIFTDGSPFTALAIDTNVDLAASVATNGRLNLWDISPSTIDILFERVQSATPEPPVIAQAPTQVAPNNETQSTTSETGQIELGAPSNAVVPSNPSVVSPVNPPTPIPNVPVNPPPATNGGRLLNIPSAGIRVGVTTFPLNQSIGTWDIDPWEPLAGHLQHTSWLDTRDNVVIGAHSEYPNGQAGIFRNLYNVGIGDEIYVSDGGLQRRYVVVNIRSVDYRDVSVVMPTGQSQLTLFTCDIPSYVAEQGLYYERLVVIAQEVPL